MEGRGVMEKEKGSMLYQFAGIFFVFGLVLTITCGIIAYFNEAATCRQEKLGMTKNSTALVENLIKEDPEDFIAYIDFYKEHSDDMKIDVERVGWQDDYDEFAAHFAAQYPGKVFKENVMPEDMPYELQLDYYEYRHEFWLSVLEDIRSSMELMYLYITVPDETTHNVLYVCDVERSQRDGDSEHMMLGDNVPNDYNKFRVEWDTWENGEQGEFQVVDNEWGHVYTFYDPLVINRRRVALLNADIKFDAVNSSILENTVSLMLYVVLVMLACIVLLLSLLYWLYLKKILFLTECVRQFSKTQDYDIAERIRGRTKGNTELSELASQTADMIDSINSHVREVLDTHRALGEAQREAALASNLATRDALTGVRNKLAYDDMCKDIDYKIGDGFKDFGIIMIDLNFLKRINDTYGHDKGNVAIKSLCEIVCKTFSHSPVFRIGGDEFAVIVENDDFARHEEKYMEFQGRISERTAEESLPMWERISAAAGMAIFNPDIDQNVDNVFKRADKAMYANKKNMKALRDR